MDEFLEQFVVKADEAMATAIAAVDIGNIEEAIEKFRMVDRAIEALIRSLKWQLSMQKMVTVPGLLEAEDDECPPHTGMICSKCGLEA
jgi:hypothetical protein